MAEMTLNDIFTLISISACFLAWASGFMKGGQR